MGIYKISDDTMEKYSDRQEAGKVLAEQLKKYAHQADTIVLALPRGGVPVGFEIATALHLPLDVFIVRKLGVPGHEELAFGAIASNNMIEYNDEVVHEAHLSPATIQSVIAKERAELARREMAYHRGRPFPTVKDKTVILVDDGVATGATIRTAIRALKQMQPALLIVAVPVIDAHLYESIQSLADVFICPLKPEHLYAVGGWYDNFSQTEDEEVYTLLSRAKNK